MRSWLLLLDLCGGLANADALGPDGSRVMTTRPAILPSRAPAGESICGKVFYCSYIMVCREREDRPPTAVRNLMDAPVCRTNVSTLTEAQVVWAELVHSLAGRPPTCVVLCHNCTNEPTGVCRGAGAR